MRLIKRILSFAGACLLSFIGSIRRNDRRGAVCRVIAMVCALTVLFSGLSIYNFAASDIDGLHNKSIKLDVNTEVADSTVTLNGLMPRNAVATVTDVTEDYSDKNRGFESYDDPTSVIAAYESSPEAASKKPTTVRGEACNLFPESWGGMLSDRKYKRRFAAGAAAALAAWLALVGALFGWPAVLSVRESALQKEVDRLSPEEAVVDQFRGRIRIIDRYSDRTWSPLEVLREVAVALPQGVTLTMFRQEAAKREALVEAAARSSAPAYEFSNRLKSSPLFSRNDIVAGPTENRNTGRTSFQLRLLFAEPGEDGGIAP